MSPETSIAQPTTNYKLRSEEANYWIELGTQVQYFDYKENLPSNPNFKSEERGIIPGVFASYLHKTDTNRFSYGFNFFFGGSDVFYDGALQNGTPAQGDSGLSLQQAQLLLNYRLFRGKFNQIELYSGLYARTWDRKLGKTGPASKMPYDEAYHSTFLPLGLKWDHYFNDRLHIGLDGSINLPLSSRFQVIFPGRMFNQSEDVTLSNSLQTNISWKIQVPITYWLSPSIGVTLNPLLESISYENSYIGTLIGTDGTLTIREPSSQTYQLGTQIKASFKL